MFTIATLILLGLLAGIYFTVKKVLKNKKVKEDKEKAQAEYLKQVRERDEPLKAKYARKKYEDSKQKPSDVVNTAVIEAIAKRKKVTKSKYHKRFI